MIGRLFHALLASSVVAGTAAGASYGVTHWMPEGAPRDTVERYVTAPGREVCARLRDDKSARRKVDAGRERLEEAGLDLKKLQDPALRAELAKGAAKAKAEAERLVHLYNVGSWAGIGFVVCLALTLFFGIESIGAALALGFKVTLALVFLQGALILGGVLVLQKLGS
ncbi:MAG: hypothetical protein HY926_05210 [Elusimicrobia bacterium]|nr:hypothetical protein [Elusimicrobiota bacterium]